jgi:hypothetical protein
VKGLALRGLRKYAAKCLRLKCYLRSPGDGRSEPRIAHRIIGPSRVKGDVVSQAAYIKRPTAFRNDILGQVAGKVLGGGS